MIDIVVPIYNAPDDLRACLESVFAHTDESAYRLTLIDDGSPDVRVKGFLAEIAAKAPRVRILFNEKNLGFTATVNRAFRETTHDVLLLNSDTIVTPGWLSAMQVCLGSAANIATVTPFSNNAEIASVPVWLHANPVLSPAEAATMAQACADISDLNWPDLPTGVGFCMLMRRAAIAAIGEFDEQTFGRGYGEENDWCQRALKANWRNVLCTSAYVMHTGSQSFSDTKQALVATNIGKLNAKHPGYDLDIQRFIARDPIAPYRNALRARFATLSQREKPGVLHILHGKDGGLERHARDLVQQQTDARHYVLLALGERWTIEDHAAGAPMQSFQIEHRQDELWKDFFDGICARFGIDTIHVHHISACRDGLLLALAQTALPYRVTLHDFYYACPAVHLLKGDDTYCNAETNPETCQRCINNHPHAPRVNVGTWRESNAALLAKAAQVIAPSGFTARTTQAYFKNIAITTIPHATHTKNTGQTALIPAAQMSPLSGNISQTLTVVGAVGPLKGARNVEAIGRRLRERKLPVRIVLIGYLDRQFHPSVREDGHFVVHGRYAPESLPGLLKAYNTSLVLFPAVGPETYGYTLSEVWQAGYAPLVADVGTLPERVLACDGGWVADVPQLNEIDCWIDLALARCAPAEIYQHKQKAAQGAKLVEQEIAASDRLNTTGGATLVWKTFVPLAPERWLEAGAAPALREAGDTKAGRQLPRRTLLFLARNALAYRHSRLGRFVERRVSPEFKRKLRSFLT